MQRRCYHLLVRCSCLVLASHPEPTMLAAYSRHVNPGPAPLKNCPVHWWPSVPVKQPSPCITLDTHWPCMHTTVRQTGQTGANNSCIAAAAQAVCRSAAPFSRLPPSHTWQRCKPDWQCWRPSCRCHASHGACARVFGGLYCDSVSLAPLSAPGTACHQGTCMCLAHGTCCDQNTRGRWHRLQR